MLAIYMALIYVRICMYIPLITITVPFVLVVTGIDRTIHWKVVVPLIENTVNESVGALAGLFSRYDGLFTIFCRVNDVPLIIHVTGNRVAVRCPQLMVTSLPLQTVVFSGGLVIITT